MHCLIVGYYGFGQKELFDQPIGVIHLSAFLNTVLDQLPNTTHRHSAAWLTDNGHTLLTSLRYCLNVADNIRFAPVSRDQSKRLTCLCLLASSNKDLNALKAGQVEQEHFTIHGLQNGKEVATEQVIIAVTGKNDGATINGSMTSKSASTITEDAAKDTLAGHLNLVDADHGEDQFTPDPHIAGTYGHLELTATGYWVYHLDNSLATTNTLSSAHGGTETFTIYSPDNTASHTITINVNGVDDPLTAVTSPAPPAPTSSLSDLSDSPQADMAPVDYYLNMVGLSNDDVASQDSPSSSGDHLAAYVGGDSSMGADPLVDDMQSNAFENPLDDEHKSHDIQHEQTLLDSDSDSSHLENLAPDDDDSLHQALNDMHSQF